jgi:hypothetical protein
VFPYTGNAGYIKGFDPATGAKAREYTIPGDVLCGQVEGTAIYAAATDDGLLRIVSSGELHGWRDGDSVHDCKGSRPINRILKMDPDSGAILGMADQHRSTFGTWNSENGFSMWNGMVMMPWDGITVRTVTFCSQFDWAELVDLGEPPCWLIDHPTDDAYFYGFDPGPVSFDATDGTPRPTWGSDRPALQLRTSGVARWLGRRLTNRQGTVPPGGSVTVEVTLDALKAGLGANQSSITIESNDPLVRSIEIPVTLTVDGPVEVSEVSTDRRYEVVDAEVGTRLYADRPYRILALDASLAGGLLVRTADRDKYVRAADHLKLSLTQPARISICVDARVGTLPAWLDGSWTEADAGVAVETGDGSASPLRVYQKNVQAGTIVLGGNGVGVPAGDRSNYAIIVNPN